jgi:hypothetical protein
VVDVVRFQGLTATSMKTSVLWEVSPCSLGDRADNGGSKHL